MNWNVLIALAVAAAVAYIVWRQLAKGPDGSAPSTLPSGDTGPVVSLPAARRVAPRVAGIASYDEYRRLNPSHMIDGKLTCNRCGSSLIRTQDSQATCTSCRAVLYGG